jgi:hypothetical protein
MRRTLTLFGAGLTCLLVVHCGDPPTPITPPPSKPDSVIVPDTTSGDSAEPTDSHSEPKPCLEGIYCTDDDPCTTDDTCIGGLCVGTPYTCDDGRFCTANECDGIGGCTFPVMTGFCLVNNQCLKHGDANPANDCERCDTDENVIGWSEREDLQPCDAGNPCTFGDYCKKGTCKKGLKSNCDDENDCTSDQCDSAMGCTNTPVSGACDDGNPCTDTSVCSGGVCHAAVTDCDDDNPCTTDTCLPDLGCAHVPIEGACEDGDACTVGDTCENATCVPGGVDTCDDNSDCTNDQCDPVFGCYYTLTGNPCCAGAEHLCDDGNPCTTDSCDENSLSCVNNINSLPCDDDEPCTVNEKCTGGTCTGGVTNLCDDANPCTSDSCDPSVGCQHVSKVSSCDDGIECTTGDTCIDGQCIGDTSDCKCVPEFSDVVARLTLLQMGTKGAPGYGLDVDQNPATCAPEGDCSGGIDNTLSLIAVLANDSLQEAIKKQYANVLFELVNPKTDGTPFTLSLYAGDPVKKWSCDAQTTVCDFEVDSETITENCDALIVLDNATIKNGKLTAGGPGYNFPIYIPLFGDVVLPVQLYFGTIVGDISLVNGKVQSITSGLLAGAVPKSVFSQALEYVNPADLPVPKEQLIQLIDIILKNDIDTGPPTGPDAASVGFQFEAIGAVIVGVED